MAYDQLQGTAAALALPVPVPEVTNVYATPPHSTRARCAEKGSRDGRPVEFARYCSDGAPPASAVTIAGGVDVTPETIGLVAGVLFLLIAVVGGGFTVKELQIP